MNRKNLVRVLLGLCMLTLLFGCQTRAVTKEPAAPKAAEKVTEPVVEAEEVKMAEDVHIKVIETSDVHGSLFPYDFINDKPAETSLAQIYSYVKEQREDTDQEVVLLDNGDVLQGQPVVYYYNFEKTDTEHILSSVMNAMGYDAATVGNHDVEAGPAVYTRIFEDSDFPWLAANAVSEKTGKPFTEPYVIIERDGVKLAVLGMITPAIPNWLPKNLYPGAKFEDMIETARKWVPIIEAKEQPDAIIGLFHSGVDAEYGGYTATDRYNENASLLVAQQVPGFDVIFTGHDHQDTHMVVKDPNGEDVHVVGALNAARSVATADLVFSWDQGAGQYQLSDVSSGTVMMGSYPADPDAMRMFGYALEEVKAWVSRPIGEITETISTRPAMFKDSKFVDLIHDLQLELTGADVSIAAPLSLDAQIAEGTVYVRDMFNLYKYENLLYTMELTGEELDDFLEYSYANWFNQMDDVNDHIIKFKTDEDGELIFNERYNSYDTATRYYNWDSAQGIRYTVDLRAPEGDRVTIKTSSEDGMKFDEQKTYTVAINSYRGNGGGGHLTNGVGLSKEEIAERTIDSTEADLRYYLIKAFETMGTVEPEADMNWYASPIAWALKAEKTDSVLLFGE